MLSAENYGYLVKTFVADKHTYMLLVNEFYKTDPTKTLLGYYDDEYVYIIPAVIIGMCDDYLTKIGSFGKFTFVTDLEGNKTAMLCPAKSLRQALTAGEGIV